MRYGPAFFLFELIDLLGIRNSLLVLCGLLAAIAISLFLFADALPHFA